MIRPANRSGVLAGVRNLKMARSAHAYVRGSTVSFYEWLDTAPGNIPEGPPVWICGDCHVGNLGPLADRKGRVSVQIRDLDQTVIGNPAHDLIRLALSLSSAARGSDLPGVATARILEQLMLGYEAALAGDFGPNAEKAMRPGVVSELLAMSMRRRWRHLAADRLETGDPVFPLGRKFWVLGAEERDALGDLFAADELRRMVTRLQGRGEGDSIRVLDAAYWVKGCSSLGRLRYAVMLRVGEGKGSGLCLVDIKEGAAAAAPTTPDAKMPRDNAVRIVTGARAISPSLGDRMVAARLLGKGVVIRELTPQDLKMEVERLTEAQATSLAAYLAGVVGKAHGRQMTAETRAAWLAQLPEARKGALQAPTWLWSSVVSLIAIHESAYLEHCRRFALAEAA